MFIGYLISQAATAQLSKKAAAADELKHIVAGREKNLRDEIEAHNETQKNYYTSIQAHLKYIFCDSVPNFDDTCRTSIYRVDEANLQFKMVFRHSKMSEWDSAGRVVLPLDEGIISAALKKGDSIYVENVPSRTSQRYERALEKCMALYNCTMPIATARKLRMDSLSYYAYAVRNFDTGRKFAIVIIESERAKNFVKTELDKEFDEKKVEIFRYVNHISRLDAKLNPHGRLP